jgi:hypothetical protein
VHDVIGEVSLALDLLDSELHESGWADLISAYFRVVTLQEGCKKLT